MRFNVKVRGTERAATPLAERPSLAVDLQRQLLPGTLMDFVSTSKLN